MRDRTDETDERTHERARHPAAHEPPRTGLHGSQANGWVRGEPGRPGEPGRRERRTRVKGRAPARRCSGRTTRAAPAPPRPDDRRRHVLDLRRVRAHRGQHVVKHGTHRHADERAQRRVGTRERGSSSSGSGSVSRGSAASSPARRGARRARDAPRAPWSRGDDLPQRGHRLAVRGEELERAHRDVVGPDVVGVAVAATRLVRRHDRGTPVPHQRGQARGSLVERDADERARRSCPAATPPATPGATHAIPESSNRAGAPPSDGSPGLATVSRKTWSRTPSAASARASSVSRNAASAGPSPSRCPTPVGCAGCRSPRPVRRACTSRR